MQLWVADGEQGLMRSVQGCWQRIGPPAEALCFGWGRVFSAGQERWRCCDPASGEMPGLFSTNTRYTIAVPFLLLKHLKRACPDVASHVHAVKMNVSRCVVGIHQSLLKIPG